MLYGFVFMLDIICLLRFTTCTNVMNRGRALTVTSGFRVKPAVKKAIFDVVKASCSVAGNKCVKDDLREQKLGSSLPGKGTYSESSVLSEGQEFAPVAERKSYFKAVTCEKPIDLASYAKKCYGNPNKCFSKPSELNSICESLFAKPGQKRQSDDNLIQFQIMAKRVKAELCKDIYDHDYCLATLFTEENSTAENAGGGSNLVTQQKRTPTKVRKFERKKVTHRDKKGEFKAAAHVDLKKCTNRSPEPSKIGVKAPVVGDLALSCDKLGSVTSEELSLLGQIEPETDRMEAVGVKATSEKGDNVPKIDILKEHRKQVSKHKKGKGSKPVANYFLAFKIYNQKVHEHVSNMQSAVIEYNEDLKHILVSLPTLHVTLLVMSLKGNDEVDSAAKALLSFNIEQLSLTREKLIFDKVDHFGNQVVFLKPQYNDAHRFIRELAYSLKVHFKLKNIVLVDDFKEFQPHLTVMKMSKKPALMKKKGIKKIPEESYKNWKSFDFGHENVSEILLCKMSGKKMEDGFYQVVEKLELYSSAKEPDVALEHEIQHEREVSIEGSWELVSHDKSVEYTDKDTFDSSWEIVDDKILKDVGQKELSACNDQGNKDRNGKAKSCVII